MLITRNALQFRKFYKEEIAREKGWLDLNFVGSLHPDRTKTETGFAKLIYGNRDDLGKLLGTIALNVAADDQAIYELIQNADDCKSNFFSVSYNEKYLLCINNGNYFSDGDMSAIINVAGNYKDGEDIGTFGIGFKILHRLVGADDGREAIINDYAGPIIFSWNKYVQLIKFIEGEPILVSGLGKSKDNYDYERDRENPWLVKILYTCFPTNYKEPIRLGDYETRDVRFDENELEEMRVFLKGSLQNVNLTEDNYLKNGSIFFLKLGKGKSKFLDDGIDKIKSGLSYSFKFLNRLNKIYINGDEIKAQEVMDYTHSFPINSQEFVSINPKNKKRDIKFTFAFYRNYRLAENLRNELVPNLYTFFSMDEEKNGFNFLLHCNAFDMNNDRRKLQANSQINEQLLPVIANNIVQYINNQKETNRGLFLSLFSNILLSKEPKSKPHINNNFFIHLKNYLFNNIPTLTGYSDNINNVKIKNTFLDINPSDFGCSEIQWFYWFNEKNDSLIINEARSSEKLNIEKWDIIDLLKTAVEEGNINHIDEWIKNSQAKTYYSFLKEIEKHITKSAIATIEQIKLFKFSDENFYSLKDVSESEDLILNYDKTSDIRFELQAIGFKSSYINITEYLSIKELIENRFNDLALFQDIATKLKNNQLRKDQKHKVFSALQNFDGIGIEKLRDIELYKNSQGNTYPLRNLLKGDLSVPNWLFSFKIHIAEYIAELDKYLVKEEEIYSELIYHNWEDIVTNVREKDISNLYEKTINYYSHKENNSVFRTQKIVYTEEGFTPSNQVFFNSEMAKLGDKYICFQNALKTLFELTTPVKHIVHYLLKEPFKIDNSRLCGKEVYTSTINAEDIKAVLSFCKLNNEQFFKHYIIKKEDVGFSIISKTNEKHQITSPDDKARKFISEHCSDKLFVLPAEFLEFKGEDGIVKADDLHSLIIDSVDINEYKVELVDIVKYKARYKLLNLLSEFYFDSKKSYTKDDYEFRILELACNLPELNETDYQKFKEKVKIGQDSESISLKAIPPFADKIKIDGVDLSLSEILPDTYQYSNILSKLLDSFLEIGLPKDKLNSLFGINSEPEPNEIFTLFETNYSVLENAQQLAFLILYGLNIEEIDFSKFKALNVNNEEVSLQFDKYIFPFDFVDSAEVLNPKYENLVNHIQQFPVSIEYADNLLFIKEPYFEENEFKCHFLNENLTDAQKLSLIEFIYGLWCNNRAKEIQKVDWSKINQTQTDTLLGFIPKYAVFPDNYASSVEKLPEYFTKWLETDQTKIQFISDMGVWSVNSVVIDLRKFLKGDLAEFTINRIAQEVRFNGDEKMLFNTFEWLKENEIQLANHEQYESFSKIVEVINANRSSKGDLEIQVNFDFEKLEVNSSVWKVVDDFTILKYDGLLPVLVKLDEINDFIFYSYNAGDFAVNGKTIYLNSDADEKNALQKVASDENNDFSFEVLWELFSVNSDIEQELRNVIAQLKQQLTRSDTANIGSDNNSGISKEQQKEENLEAKQLVKEKLMADGYVFPTNYLEQYSTINGVKKDNEDFPLVVKSYKYQSVPFKISANEWLHLMNPNSMFWVHMGQGKLGCLKLFDLLRNQSQMSISFSTVNLDFENRIEQFAEILHYFKDVHFDFENFSVTNIASNLKDYRFDNPQAEDDITDSNSELML